MAALVGDGKQFFLLEALEACLDFRFAGDAESAGDFRFRFGAPAVVEDLVRKRVER